jgi:hypothetical protein
LEHGCTKPKVTRDNSQKKWCNGAEYSNKKSITTFKKPFIATDNGCKDNILLVDEKNTEKRKRCETELESKRVRRDSGFHECV